MRILITGGAGFVGSNIAKALKLRFPNYVVSVADNLTRRGSEINLPELKRIGIKFHHADIRLISDVQDLPLCDLLIDASADPSVLAGISSSTSKLIESNLLGTINLLEWASKNRSSIIFLSTSRVYPIEKLNQIILRENEKRFEVTESQVVQGITSKGISESFPLDGSRSFYGAAKLCSELIIGEYHKLKDLKVTILRCGVIAGPGQFGKVDQGIFVHWLASHYWKRELGYFGYGGHGKQVRDFLHIEDVTQLIDHLIANFELVNGRTLNVGGGHSNSLSLQELTELCQSVTGNKIVITAHPENRIADIPYYVSDNSFLESISHWKPKYSLTSLLEDTFVWLRKNESQLKEII